ncbi:hypothetical protein ALC53_07863 [Atta colombica]|uniref:Uncharacterized protein n=3 Tax=Atta colombica TaxID=520822 RepID=A0A195BBX8_9HYME|nr:hypothetical protein ALC53_07863 [Atta colombica]
MKKTDTCYYMSITKEENSAFVVANNQGGIGEATQVIVETKTDATSANNGSATSTPTTNAVTATMNSTGATSATMTTTTTTISTSCTGCGDGNGTAINNGADVHQRFSNSCNITLSETLCRQETCTGPRVQDRSNGPQDHRAPLPQVILQVLPSTPIPTQHYNLLASNVHPTYLDPGGFGDSRQCLKEGGSTPQTPITGNHLDVPRSLDPNPNLLSPEILMQRRGSRRPSILPVPDMLTSSTLHLPGQESLDHEADESEDEMDDDVPWRSPSEKIA